MGRRPFKIVLKSPTAKTSLDQENNNNKRNSPEPTTEGEHKPKKRLRVVKKRKQDQQTIVICTDYEEDDDLAFSVELAETSASSSLDDLLWNDPFVE